MRQKTVTKIVALVLTLTTLFTMAGCGSAVRGTTEPGTENTGNEASTEKAEHEQTSSLPTVTLYPDSAKMQSGILDGYKGEVMAKFGFSLDIWAFSDEKTNAILASGDMPDVMYVNGENLALMIESGMVLNLEDYLDQLPNIKDNEFLNPALNYTREYRSAGTGELYGIPTSVAGTKIPAKTLTKNMITINWPYYKAVGYPEFKDQWELLDVMQEMLEKNPVGEDGIPNQGTYLNTGSDTSYWANITQYLKWFGYEPTNLRFLLETDMVNSEYHSILEDDSKYLEGLRWYNTAYRKGLLDPDSINTDRETQKAKVDNGHAMVSSGTIQGYDAGGYQPVYMPGEKIYQETWNSLYGNDCLLVISAKSKNIDAALKFINMLADPDANFEFFNGPEGDIWYLEDGFAYLRQDIIDNYSSGQEILLASGEKINYDTFPWIDGGAKVSFKEPDGNDNLIRLDNWTKIREKLDNTEQQNEWRELSGYEYYIDQVTDAGNYYLTSELDYVTNFTSTPDDMMNLTLDSIKDKVVNASWQMVYAKTDQEFEQIWNQMVQDCKALGADEVIAWKLDDLKKAKEIKDSLME